MIYLRHDIAALFETERTVSDFLAIDCEVARDFKNRQTGRFERDGRAFYIKKHDRAYWWALVDELLHLRKPHVGAGHEKAVLERLAELKVPTMRVAGFGAEGRCLAYQRSFLITDEIAPTISLEQLSRNWRTRPPDARLKRGLIRQVADIARTMHADGINHRDFYLAHFLLDTSDPDATGGGKPTRLFLIDLHRAQRRRKVPIRMRVKDIGGLYFSAMDIGLTARDLLRFVRAYAAKSLSATLEEDRIFWRKVRKRAVWQYRKMNRRNPDLVGARQARMLAARPRRRRSCVV